MIRSRYPIAALWLALVLFMGASYFAASKTAAFILPILKFLAPHATVRQLHVMHFGVRKMAHVTEYAILAVLWFKALVLSARRTPRVAAWIALSVCLLCAFADEAHQSTLPMRSGSARDFVIDSLGAVAALILIQARRTPPDRTTPLGSPVAVETAD